MAEEMNVEIAHTLHDQSMEAKERQRPFEVLEFVEAILLAVVAVATAWSGYQAAGWDGLSALLYGQASKYRVTANQLATLGGQQRLFDVVTFNTWIQAKTAGDDKVAAGYARRFSPEYRVAFDAWLKTKPAHNLHAPPGPTFMPEYHNHLMEQAASIDRQASTAFARGTAARERGDQCVLNTVLLAAVLFLCGDQPALYGPARAPGAPGRGVRTAGRCLARYGNLHPYLMGALRCGTLLRLSAR